MDVSASLQTVSMSWRREGLLLTARKIVSALRDPWFDLRHGTDTSGRVATAAMSLSSPNVEHAVDYEPTSHHELRVLLRRLDVPGRRGSFVDFGCGKGRVLLLATEYGFDRVVGVEFSSQLAAIARANARRFCSDASPEVVILDEDAARYRFRDDETVLFFFNPFRDAVMRQVLDNVYESLRRRNRQVWIIYSNPRCRSLLESGGVFLKTSEHRLPRTRAFVYTNVGTDPTARSPKRLCVPSAGGRPEHTSANATPDSKTRECLPTEDSEWSR